jgi:putative ABC transport system permease protein
MSLARSTLIYEYRKFLPAVMAVAFSGLLVLIQVGLLLGLFSGVSVPIDLSGADLWAGFPDTKSVELARPISIKNEFKIRMHSEVKSVERMYFGIADWRKPDGGTVSGYLYAFDSDENRKSFMKILTPELREALKEPGSLIVAEEDLNKLDVKVGEYGHMNGKKARIIGTVKSVRGVGGASFLCSSITFRKLDQNLQNLDLVPWFLIELKNSERANIVMNELNEEQQNLSQQMYKVWLAHELSLKSQLYWLFETGVGIGVGFASLLGLVVGAAITSQTLMSAISSSIREYATLRALGVSFRSLTIIVAEQTFWVGGLGMVITIAGAFLLEIVAKKMNVAILLPWWLLATTAFLVIFVAFVSGFLALRALRKADPATLLR